MLVLKEVREKTGLSQHDMAYWLGISRALVSLVEIGKRKLPSQAMIKLSAMIVLLNQNESAANKGPAQPEPEEQVREQAAGHKNKMKKFLHKAAVLQRQLDKLKTSHPLVSARIELLELLKKAEFEWFKKTDRDLTQLNILKDLAKRDSSKSNITKQHILQDKIDLHLAYADIHKKHWEKFSNR